MESSNAKIIAAFLAGAAAGASLGLLLAPDKGVNTRRQIRESLGEITGRAKETIDDLADKAKETFETYRARPTVDADDEPVGV